MLVDAEGGQISKIEIDSFMDGCFTSRLNKLKEHKVDVILCGGFNRSFVPLAESLGIRVISGISGRAKNAALAFVQGQALPTFRNAGRMGNSPGRGRFGRGQKNRTVDHKG